MIKNKIYIYIYIKIAKASKINARYMLPRDHTKSSYSQKLQHKLEINKKTKGLSNTTVKYVQLIIPDFIVKPQQFRL